MYEIYVDNVCLYYPGDKINTVREAKTTEELNTAGSMNITVPLSNPLYDKFYERKSVVEVRKNGAAIWGGEVRNITQNMKKDKKIYVVGDMSYLQDSLQPPQIFENVAPVQLLGVLINEHNAQVEDRKKFTVGVVTIDVPVLSIKTNYDDTLTVIRSQICEPNAGYIRIRRENGIRYIDLVKIEDYGKTCEQPIQFGRNLLDYVQNTTSDEIVTAIVPLGEQLEDSADGLETFVTIVSVNDGEDYIYNQEAVDAFGWVRRKVNFDGVTDPQELLTAAKEWLSTNQYAKLIIEVKAVDLSAIIDTESFELGDYTNAKAAPFGLDAWYYIRKKVTNLLDKGQNTITIGNTTAKTFTQQTQTKLGKVEKEIPNATKILEAARQNASNLIQMASKGNFYWVYDEEGNPKELLVMDTKDINTAKQVWRWNINGLGYSLNGYNGDYKLAMTMDAHLLAGNITVDGLEVGKNVKMGADATIAWENVLCEGNMLQNTDNFSDSKLWWGNHTKLGATTDPNGGNEAYSFQGNTEGNGYLIQSNVFQKSGQYILSFWAKASYDCDIYVGGKSFRAALVSLTTEWQKFTVSFECTITDPEWFCFGSYGTWTETDVIISLYHPMLETGSIASGWTSSAYMPSEDYATKITKNTVTAEYVNALGIAAKELTAGNGRKLIVDLNGIYLTSYTQKVIDITDNGDEIAYLNFLNEQYPVTGLSSIDSYGAAFPSLVVGTGASKSSDSLGCNLKAYFFDNIVGYEDLIVSGTKSRVSHTENYNDRLLYCYEMPTPYFGDIGEGQLDESGICYVYIDDIFLETIDTGCMYHVFLQKYGEGEAVVSERNGNYFVVTGTPGLSFAWEIKAKQAGYTMERLDEFTQLTEEETVNYEAEATAYLSEYERSILNYA